MSFTLSIHKSRAKAEEWLKIWAGVYSEDNLSIDFDGSRYLLTVTLSDEDY